jgi:putative peptidoglycan lipid II flippase
MKPNITSKVVGAWKKFANGSTDRKIFAAALTVGFLSIFVKIASLVKELVIAWNFGTQDALDAFLIAFLIPEFIINIIQTSFAAAFIPTYIKVREEEGIIAAQKLFGTATLWSLGLLAIVTVIMIITAPIYLPWMTAGFDANKLDLCFKLLCGLSPLILIGGWSTIWGAVLNSGERFALAAVCPIITPIISILLLYGIPSWGIFNLVIGFLIGSSIEMLILGRGLQKQKMWLIPQWYGYNRHMQDIASQYAPSIAGALLICSAGAIDRTMAAMLEPGSVAALNYGNRVIASPISLITLALGTAVVPYFSKTIASGDWQGIEKTFNRYLKLIFIFTVPLTILLLIFSQPIIKVLFERGAFTAEDTIVVSQIQSFAALQIPFYIANILVVRLISSMRKNKILLWVSFFNFLINIIGNYIFMQWLDIRGIALSTSCVYLFSFVFVLVFAQKELKNKQQY